MYSISILKPTFLNVRAKPSATLTNVCPLRIAIWLENYSRTAYLFDFLDVGKEANEREIEAALIKHITG
jgi:hypothetical protein